MSTNTSKKIIDIKQLLAPIPWGVNDILEFYAVIDDRGNKLFCPIVWATSKNDVIKNLYFDGYGNLKYLDHYLDNSLVSLNEFIELIQGN